MKSSYLLLLFCVLTVVSCTTTTIPETDSAALSSSREQQLLRAVKSVNSSTPKKVKAGVTVVGTLNGQEYSADGIAYLTDDPVRAKVVLSDRIFKTQIAHILADPSRMQMYFPIEKTAYSINGDFSDPDLRGRSDSQLLLAYTFTAKIPLLSPYTVEEYRKSSDQSTEILTIKNGDIIERITFSKGKPIKVELENSRYGSKYIIRYYGMYEQEGYTFFKRIKAYSTITGDKATIHYNVIRVNPPMNEGAVFRLSIPEGTNIIR